MRTYIIGGSIDDMSDDMRRVYDNFADITDETSDNSDEKLAAAQKLYDNVKDAHPIHTNFDGDLDEVVRDSAGQEIYDFLRGHNLLADVDGLLDFLHGAKMFNVLPPRTVDRIIKAVKRHCK